MLGINKLMPAARIPAMSGNPMISRLRAASTSARSSRLISSSSPSSAPALMSCSFEFKMALPSQAGEHFQAGDTHAELIEDLGPVLEFLGPAEMFEPLGHHHRVAGIHA